MRRKSVQGQIVQGPRIVLTIARNLIVAITLGIPTIVLLESFLGFLGFAVKAPTDSEFSTVYGRGEVTHTCLNDGVVEGLALLDRPAFSVQYHPEASPGPQDSFYLFERFAEAIRARRAA